MLVFNLGAGVGCDKPEPAAGPNARSLALLSRGSCSFRKTHPLAREADWAMFPLEVGRLL